MLAGIGTSVGMPLTMTIEPYTALIGRVSPSVQYISRWSSASPCMPDTNTSLPS